MRIKKNSARNSGSDTIQNQKSTIPNRIAPSLQWIDLYESMAALKLKVAKYIYEKFDHETTNRKGSVERPSRTCML